MTISVLVKIISILYFRISQVANNKKQQFANSSRIALGWSFY